MNICEDNFERAVRTFLREAQIPVPEGWGRARDKAQLYTRIYPAFLKALGEIEEVHMCHGFTLPRPPQGEGQG